MNPFFSFIVPCYDVEQYVGECIQSVLNQSFQDWECIIGIETSNDRTEEIIRKKTAGDPRFRIFTGPCTGSCSVIRNTGIDMARGEYLIFLDGDDFIADGCLARIHEKICANPGADLYPCAIIIRNEIFRTRDNIRDNYRADAPAEMNGVDATVHIYNLLSYGKYNPCHMLQLTIHRRLFLLEHDIKNIPGIRSQDTEFSPRALYYAKRVVPLHEPYYIYRIRPNSVQRIVNQNIAEDYLQDLVIIQKSLLAFYDKVSREEGFDERIPPCWLGQWLKRIGFRWFSIKYIQKIPQKKRVEMLKSIIENPSSKRLIHCGTFMEKVIAFHIWIFTQYPALRWYVYLCYLSAFSVIKCCKKTKSVFTHLLDRF